MWPSCAMSAQWSYLRTTADMLICVVCVIMVRREISSLSLACQLKYHISPLLSRLGMLNMSSSGSTSLVSLARGGLWSYLVRNNLVEVVDYIWHADPTQFLRADPQSGPCLLSQ